MKKSKEEVIELIDKLLKSEGTEKQEEQWLHEIETSVPFYEKIYNIIFFSNEELTAEEVYQQAKSEHKPILL